MTWIQRNLLFCTNTDKSSSVENWESFQRKKEFSQFATDELLSVLVLNTNFLHIRLFLCIQVIDLKKKSSLFFHKKIIKNANFIKTYLPSHQDIQYEYFLYINVPLSFIKYTTQSNNKIWIKFLHVSHRWWWKIWYEQYLFLIFFSHSLSHPPTLLFISCNS
jgi:hypothetical protein